MSNLSAFSAPDRIAQARRPGVISRDEYLSYGRYVMALRGEDLPHSRLTHAQVSAIRARFVPYCRINGAAAIARELGVHVMTIRKILAFESWRHVA